MVSPSAEVCPHCGAKYPASYIPSKVTVHRMSGVLGFGVGMTVTIDGEKVGELRKNGDAITFSLPYGDYTLKVKGPFFGTLSGQTTIRILPAKVYRIEVSLSAGFPEHHANFQSYVTEA